MYSAITPRTAIVSEKVRKIKPTIVPYPAKGTPRNIQKAEKISTEKNDIPLRIKPDNEMKLIGLVEFAKMPFNENLISS